MWYKNGIWCDDESDTDEDELPDYMELILGTNINSTDSDSDNLPDGYEVMTLGTDPTLTDSDSNNISDAAEDADSDGLNNLTEYQLGTNPLVEDSDNDDLTDSAEVSTYYTDPTDEDTDGDGANDGWEVLHSTNPLVANSDFDVTVALGFRDDDVAPSVSVEDVTGEQAQSLSIVEETANSYYINDTVGAIGSAYDFSMTGEFDSAEISFEFDSDLLLDPDFDPVIYWFDEENQELVPLTTTVTGNAASAQVDHFSIYILTNRTEYLDSFTWYDTFARTNYSNIKSVFVISDCESLGSGVNGQNIDTTYRRLDYARQIAASLPTSSLTMTIKYGDYIFSYEEGMYNPGDINTHINTLNFQTNITDNQDSLPDNVVRFAINHYLSDTNDNCMKIVFLITDGKANHEIHQFTLDAIAQNNVRVFTVDIGSNTQAKLEYLKHFAEVSNGYYCDATQTGGIQKLIDQMQLYYSFGTDSDLDGIPDDYEDSLILFNGKSIITDKNDSDTDDDNLSDGEEVRLSVIHHTSDVISFVGKIFSDPTDEDSDKDGYIDGNDENRMEWDVGDRDLAMFSCLSYEDGTSYSGGFYGNINSQKAKDSPNEGNIDSGEGYYWMNYACSKELSDRWRIVSYVNVTSLQILNVEDQFSATAYLCDNNVIVAFRGTGEDFEWFDDIVNYGFFNFHSEELAARAFIKEIYKNHVLNHPNRKLYLTGHSLGGYLAQIAGTEIIPIDNDQHLKKIVYFNGMGMLYNEQEPTINQKIINQTKRIYMQILSQFHERNHNGVICYKINGDIISTLGTHVGAVIRFNACTPSITYHNLKEGNIGYIIDINDENFESELEYYLISYFGSIAVSVVDREYYQQYYSLYNSLSFMAYMWITHETDSFLYYISQGTREYV